jgi:hypothetical protein
MQNDSYTTSFEVSNSPAEVFQAISNVRGWWSEGITGDSSQQGDEFVFEVPDVHRSKQRLVEVIPDKKIVWLITESNMTFLKQRDEWTGTKVVFEITPIGDKTRLTFVHEGLTPDIECYKFCMPSWAQYVGSSLRSLITTGKGTPNLEGKTIDKPVTS